MWEGLRGFVSYCPFIKKVVGAINTTTQKSQWATATNDVTIKCVWFKMDVPCLSMS